jgi:hypothetical protein
LEQLTKTHCSSGETARCSTLFVCHVKVVTCKPEDEHNGYIKFMVEVIADIQNSLVAYLRHCWISPNKNLIPSVFMGANKFIHIFWPNKITDL